MRTKEYLGDGVYAEFDGYGIWLKANNYENPTDKIILSHRFWKHLTYGEKHWLNLERKVLTGGHYEKEEKV